MPPFDAAQTTLAHVPYEESQRPPWKPELHDMVACSTYYLRARPASWCQPGLIPALPEAVRTGPLAASGDSWPLACRKVSDEKELGVPTRSEQDLMA